MCLLLIQQIEN